MRRRPLLLLAGGLSAVAVSPLLTWWRAAGAPVLLVPGPSVALAPGTATGWQVLGPARAGAVVGLAVVGLAVVAVAMPATGRVPLPARLLVTVAGAAAATAGTAALLTGSGPAGPWVATLGGASAVGAALAAGRARLGVAAAAVLGTLGAVLTGPAPGAPVADGPYVRLGALGRAAHLAVVDGTAAVVDVSGLTRPGPDARPEVLARVPDGDRGRAKGVLGVAGDRVVRWTGADTLLVTGLHAGDPVAVGIHDVADAGRVGSDGSVWLRTPADPPDTVRRLDLSAYDGTQDLAATYLPVVTILAPADGMPLRVPDLHPVDGGALRASTSGPAPRVDRVTPTPGGVDIAPLVGGLDPACGLVADPRAAFLTTVGSPVPDTAGGVWFVAGGTRLVRLGPDGVLRAVPAPPPGVVSDLVTTPDGALVLAVSAPDGVAVWRLPGAVAALADLPTTPPGCLAAPPPVGPAVGLVAVGGTAGDPLGTPLDTSGRWASGRPGGSGAIVAVTPDGRRTPLGTRQDGTPGAVVPDGSGGVWWLEDTAGRSTLVHGRPGAAEQRFPAVVVPGEGRTLLTDLGGRAPLVGTAAGAFRIDRGSAEQVVGGRIDGGVVRPDGRGWVLADGRLLALDGDHVLGPVIDAGPARDDTVPVVVQRAKGVPPDRLALPHAHLGLDGRGRALVVTDGVALAVDAAGMVTVVAQDPRLDAPFTVEGGLVQVDGGTLVRVDLPS